MEISTNFYIYLSLFFLCSGMAIVLVKRSVIFVLIGIELMLNAANINLIVFSQSDTGLSGQIMAIFVVVLAAAEVSVALAILLNVYKQFNDTDLDKINSLKH